MVISSAEMARRIVIPFLLTIRVKPPNVVRNLRRAQRNPPLYPHGGAPAGGFTRWLDTEPHNLPAIDGLERLSKRGNERQKVDQAIAVSDEH